MIRFVSIQLLLSYKHQVLCLNFTQYFLLQPSQFSQMLDWIKNKTTKNRRDFGKFNFHVKNEPQTIDSSTTLSLTAYTNSSENATIPCRYRWSIIKHGLTIQVPEFKGSSFKCEPSDVGSIIQAEIISTDPEYGGNAILQFGPVKLDVTLKKQIQIALSTGCATMPIYLVNNGDEKQCQIRLFQDVIKINHAYSETNYTFDYSIFQPRVQCMSKDSSRVIIIFNQKYESQLRRFTKRLFDEPIRDLTSSIKSNQSTHLDNSNQTNKLDIKFMNRHSRDTFLFSLKAFNTKKQLRSSTIINKIQKIDFSNQETFDFILQIEGLKSQLVKMDWVVRKAHQQKLRYMEEVHKLQKQIEEIIVTYTRIVEQKFQNQVELSRDYSMLSTKRDEIVSRKYRNMENQNNHLNSRIQTLTKEIDVIRFMPQTGQTQMIQPQMIQPQMFQPIVQQGMMIQNISNIQEKVHFNFQNNQTPFSKKRSYEDVSAIGNILDELGQSRVSSISYVRQDPGIRRRLDEAENEKQLLQNKLEKSFHRIDSLEKELFQKKLLNTPNNQKLNSSAINFTYKIANDSMANYANPLSMSVVIDKEKQSLITENAQLKKSNVFLETEKRKLIDQLKNSRKMSPITKNVSKPHSGDNSDTSLNFLKTQRKDSNFLEKQKKDLNSGQKQKELMQRLGKKESHINLLRMENDELKKVIQKLRKQVQGGKALKQKLQRRIHELQQEIDMYRKNSNALNRSQHLSIEMDNYNEDQIVMLKQHNQFLTAENQKLAKACEKYMGEAKQTNKLRMQIIKLKQKINQLQMLNSSSMVI